ncbi:ABC transporter substrate-binding protein [Actinomadura graeca]|uniref:ABC transporter substrate-binding protein n=1 Tax=Actinomadura graeca TaxID=2750812 RepID=UPI001E6096F5|nr:ABC transporter substrate-binding protein [Actinomadura graeca]
MTRARSGRPFFRVLGAATGVATAVTLAGCAPADRADGGSGSGTLRIAASTDAGESLNPYASNQSPTQELRSAQLYEGLTHLDPAGKLEWRLATEMTPNADLDEWTIKLRPGVKFTDGTEFTSADVVASIKYLRDPKHAVQGLAYIEKVDAGKVEAVDKLTVKVGLTKPFGPFKEIWANAFLPMTKAGSVPAKPIGTGPFVVKSFTAGRQSTLERFEGYWGTKPKLGTVSIIEYQSQQAQANALLSGQVDVASGATPTIAKSLQGKKDIGLLDSKGNFVLRIGLNTTVAPFNDPRVRQALRLLVDRQQVVSTPSADTRGWRTTMRRRRRVPPPACRSAPRTSSRRRGSSRRRARAACRSRSRPTGCCPGCGSWPRSSPRTPRRPG